MENNKERKTVEIAPGFEIETETIEIGGEKLEMFIFGSRSKPRSKY